MTATAIPCGGRVPLRRVAARLQVDTALLVDMHRRGDFPSIEKDPTGQWLVDELDAARWFQRRAVDESNRPDRIRARASAAGRPMTP